MKPNLDNFEAVIFDMDGVIIDSEPLWKIAMEEVFNALGSNLTKQDFQKTVGLRLDEVVQFWHEHEQWKNFTPKEIEKNIVNKMIALIKQNAKPLAGVVETLQYLKENEYKIGLATSSYEILINTVLEALNIKQYFDFTHSAENEAFGKPHPAVYLTVSEKLAVSPQKCLVIEDSLNGIIAAKAARMNVLCIPEKTHHHEPKLIVADWMMESMEMLLVK